jgi:hypothetical protein
MKTEGNYSMSEAPERLDQRAVDRVAGATWDGVRQQFFDISGVLFELTPSVRSELTTIYVKFMRSAAQGEQPFAVVWLKDSKQVTVGLALPSEFFSPITQEAPRGMKYAGLTGYFTVKSGGIVPNEFAELAKTAIENVAK